MEKIETRDFMGLAIATNAFSDETPRCRDVDLGKFLGYSRPRDVRKLIERELKAKNLNDSHVRAVVARTDNGPKHEAFGNGKVVTEYWLTEIGALFVVSRSETKIGADILHRLIAAWVASRQDVRVQNILALCWAKEPQPVQTMFAPLIRALLDMRGEESDKTPPWARILASMCYAWAFGPDGETGQQRHRRSTEPDCKRPDYWWLNGDGLRQLQKVIDTGIDYTFQAVHWEQWVAMMRRRFEGRPIQLFFSQVSRRLSGRKNGAVARLTGKRGRSEGAVHR